MIGMVICAAMVLVNVVFLALGAIEGQFYFWNLISGGVRAFCLWTCWEISR